MNAARIVLIALLAVVAVYLVLLHSANPALLQLPFMIGVPPAVALAVALALGFLAGWLPVRIALWRRTREARRLRARVEELEHHLPSYDRASAQRGRTGPVIPDRFRVGAGLAAPDADGGSADGPVGGGDAGAAGGAAPRRARR